MKNLLNFILAFVLMIFMHPSLLAQLTASTEPIPSGIEEYKDSQEERVRVLSARLLEIRDMDKSKLTSSQRKELKRELRAIERELKHSNGGIYLSAGSIIIIILLLILIF